MKVKTLKPKKCRACGNKFQPWNSLQTCCSPLCAIEYDKQKKTKKAAKERAETKRADKHRLKELMTRTQWFARLQVVVNQWVMYRDRDEPCCTCQTTRPIKYDAGHFHTRKARPDIRFEETQIHKQCSQKCNVYGSGQRLEYEQFLVKKYGQKHVDWLAEVKPSLKIQFPHWTDIEESIIVYRKKLRGVGIKPHL